MKSPIQCLLCNETFIHDRGEITAYLCTDCNNFKVVEPGSDADVESLCLCGGVLMDDSPPRCPRCGVAGLSSPVD